MIPILQTWIVKFIPILIKHAVFFFLFPSFFYGSHWKFFLDIPATKTFQAILKPIEEM